MSTVRRHTLVAGAVALPPFAIRNRPLQAVEFNSEMSGKPLVTGLVSNDIDPVLSRDPLKNGFLGKWRGNYVDEAWRIMEGSVGGLW